MAPRQSLDTERPEIRFNWAERLRERRKALGLSQEAVADLIGAHQTGINRYERGVTVPSTDSQVSLSRALCISVTALFPRTDDEAKALEG